MDRSGAPMVFNFQTLLAALSDQMHLLVRAGRAGALSNSLHRLQGFEGLCELMRCKLGDEGRSLMPIPKSPMGGWITTPSWPILAFS